MHFRRSVPPSFSPIFLGPIFPVFPDLQNYSSSLSVFFFFLFPFLVLFFLSLEIFSLTFQALRTHFLTSKKLLLFLSLTLFFLSPSNIITYLLLKIYLTFIPQNNHSVPPSLVPSFSASPFILTSKRLSLPSLQNIPSLLTRHCLHTFLSPRRPSSLRPFSPSFTYPSTPRRPAAHTAGEKGR